MKKTIKIQNSNGKTIKIQNSNRKKQSKFKIQIEKTTKIQISNRKNNQDSKFKLKFFFSFLDKSSVVNDSINAEHSAQFGSSFGKSNWGNQQKKLINE